MEERTANIIFNKTGRGAITTKITLPVPWIRDLEITEENREVVLTYDKENKIIQIKNQ